MTTLIAAFKTTAQAIINFCKAPEPKVTKIPVRCLGLPNSKWTVIVRKESK